MIPSLDLDGRSDLHGSTTASAVAVRVNLPLRKSEPFSIHVVLPSDSSGFGLSTWLMPRSSYRAVAERAIWITQASLHPWFFSSFQDLPLLLLPSLFLPTSGRHHSNSTVPSGVPLTTLVVPITTPATPPIAYAVTAWGGEHTHPIPAAQSLRSTADHCVPNPRGGEHRASRGGIFYNYGGLVF
jgi:hypothetical protein